MLWSYWAAAARTSTKIVLVMLFLLGRSGVMAAALRRNTPGERGAPIRRVGAERARAHRNLEMAAELGVRVGDRRDRAFDRQGHRGARAFGRASGFSFAAAE